MIQLEIDIVDAPDGRFQGRVFAQDDPTSTLHLTPIARADQEDAQRDARAWIWKKHPKSNFGNFDELA